MGVTIGSQKILYVAREVGAPYLGFLVRSIKLQTSWCISFLYVHIAFSTYYPCT